MQNQDLETSYRKQYLQLEDHFSEKLKDSQIQSEVKLKDYNDKLGKYRQINDELKNQVDNLKNQSFESQNSSVLKESLRLSEMMSPQSLNLSKNGCYFIFWFFILVEPH